MRDSNTCKLRKVDTKESESDLLKKIHDSEADQFERLRDRCMVFRAIPTGQPADQRRLSVGASASVRRQRLRRQ